MLDECVDCEDDDSLRENILHSYCHILGQLYSIIIDKGNKVNFASSRLVESYKLQWLNSKGEMAITKQVSLAFMLGKYSDEVLCDIVTLKPLSPKEVNKYQVKMKLMREKGKKRVKRKDEKNDGEKKRRMGVSKGTMLDSFQKNLPKDIPRGLPPIKGIEDQIDFTIGVTLPNRYAYRASLEERRKIQQ
ncbi:hypothetical protein CR513_33889, partial [Mucuna pruriens]